MLENSRNEPVNYSKYKDDVCGEIYNLPRLEFILQSRIHSNHNCFSLLQFPKRSAIFESFCDAFCFNFSKENIVYVQS